jgi:exodeoxyribonuclease V gamma subunit
MFRVHRSNRLERLADALADELRGSPLEDPLAPEWVAVQSLGGRDFLARGLARRLGVCANVAMPFPTELFNRIAAWVLGEDLRAVGAASEDRVALAAIEELPGLLEAPVFAPVRAFLDREAGGAALYGLARKAAHAFSEYALYRPEMIAAWARGAVFGGWQPILFRAVMARLGGHGGAPATSQSELVARVVEAVRRGGGRELPARISLFGVTSLPLAYLDALAAVGRATEVHLYVSAPSREFLGDAESGGCGNPVVSSFGRVAREFQGALEERTAYAEGHDLFEAPPEMPTTVLATLQRDMLGFARRGAGSIATAPRIVARADDSSLEIFACRGALRQVEIVREELLTLFADRALGLRPEEVAILAPDIARFAPFIDAVLGGVPNAAGPRSIAIPHAVQGGPSRAPCAEVAGDLLALADARLTVKEMMAFVSRPIVRGAFGLDRAQVDALMRASLAAGARFGIDAAHRGRLGLPALEDATWRFARDRMLLGLAFSGDDCASWRGLAPFDGGDAEEPKAVARFATCLDAVTSAVASLAAPRPIAAWCADVRRAVEVVCGGGEKAMLEPLDEALGALGVDAAHAGSVSPISPATFAVELAARTADANGGLAVTGGVVCADLARMRGVPFRVVFILGLDDGVFPRRSSPPGFDLMASEPRPGDRSPRDEDMAVFLEAIAAARERLVLAYSVGSGARGDAPPSSVVGVLLDALEEGFENAPAVVRPPLEPLAPWRSSEGARGSLRASRLRVEAPLELEPLETTRLALDDLVRFFRDPSRHFCERALGVRIRRRGDEIPEREALVLDALAKHAIGNEGLRAVAAGAGFSYEAMIGKGVLPVGPFGRLEHEALAEAAREVSSELLAFSAGPGAGARDVVTIAVELETELGPCALAGAVDGVGPGGRLCAEFGRRDGKRLVEAWVRHLALSCGGDGGRATTFMFHRADEGKVRAELGEVETPEALLTRLVEIYWRGQREPLSLFPKTSFEYASALIWQPKKGRRRTPEEIEERALKLALKAWQGDDFTGAPPGECEEPSTRLLWGEEPPWETDAESAARFRRLAVEVYGPLLAHSKGVT